MKPEKSHIAHIRKAFNQMRSTQDFLDLLNFAKPLVYGDEVRPFELKHISWYLNPKLGRKKYNQFHIKKKSGAERTIHAPAKGLKTLQKTLNFILNCVFEPHSAAFGFVPGKSIVDNANIHVGSRYVYNIDLKDFFPSIDQARVWKCLQLKPFNLHNNISTQLVIANEDTSQSENLNALDSLSTDNNKVSDERNSTEHKIIDSAAIKDNNRLKIANIISSICCTEMEVERKNENGQWQKVLRNVLPQGAPTSPVITNIVCQRLDFLLTGVARRFGLKYSRYADDITFSSMHNVYQTESEFLIELHRIIAEQNFHIKESKTRLQKDGYRKEVTGLLVNEKANVQKRYIKQLRMWLYYWERYGFDKASLFFKQQYLNDKSHVKNGIPDMVNVIGGKMEFLKMVKGKNNEMYVNLNKRFEILTGKYDSKTIDPESQINSLKNSREASNLKVKLEDNYEEKYTNDKSQQIKIELSYPISHNPTKTVNLLRYFTENDKSLKYSTHSWEEGKFEGYDDFIQKITDEWKIVDDIKNQNNKLHAKISNFLFNKTLGQKNDKGYYDCWGEKRLTFGWGSPELKTYMLNSGKSPFSCPIPEDIKKIDNKYNMLYFKDYAEVFKNEIEFREDSNNFKKIILDLWTTELSYDFNIIGVKELVGFSFFTDVSYIKETFRILFCDLFKTRPEYPEITIEKESHFENKGYHLIRITQKNSFVTREINDPKFKTPTGNLHSIIKNLNNLADYSLLSKFADGKFYRINYLTSNKQPFIKELESPESENVGFTHEFKFYL